MSIWTLADLKRRLVRYADLRPCTSAFVDTRTPGSDRKENFTIIGPGVSENPDQYVHIAEPHGFNIGGARQPPGCLNSQHSHDTAEVFIIHTGRWRFMWGEHADDGAIELGPGDVINLPIHMFRGFENVGAGPGFMFAVLGGDDAGKVTWAPRVFELAKDYGLVLLEGGRLIDTMVGETVPAGARHGQPPSDAELQALRSPDNATMGNCVIAASELQASPTSPLTAAGVEECAVIGKGKTADGFHGAPLVGWWPLGFNLRCLRLAPGATVPAHSRSEAEVILMHQGELTLTTPTGLLSLRAGDTFSTPVCLAHGFKATGADPTIAFVVRGGDSPAAPSWARQEAA